MRIVSSLFLVLLTFAASGACSSDKAPPLTPASGTTLTQADVIKAVATAQCDHEQKCNHIGPERDFASREHCMSKMSGELQDKLADCKHKIDDNDVRDCIGATNAQSCGGAMDDLKVSMACNDDMCD